MEDSVKCLNKKMTTEIKTCETCGQKIREYKVGISKMMVSALVKFRMAVLNKGQNCIHLLKDMEGTAELTPHEWNNFSRLRFHGLAVKVRGSVGYWLLTKRGADFLNGKAEIPKEVWVRNNVVVERSEEKIFIKDVSSNPIYMERLEDIVYRSFEPKQESLI